MRQSHTVSLRSRWLNYVMHLTAAIAERKQDLSKIHAVKNFFDVLTIILLEGVLAIVTIPLYFSTHTSTLSPDNEFNVQYSIRKALTFSLFFLLALVFIGKIVVVGRLVTARLQRTVSVSNVSLPSSQQMFSYISAQVDDTMPVPNILNIESGGNTFFTVHGKAVPSSTVFIHAALEGRDMPFEQIYIAVADLQGQWSVSSTQLYDLDPGKYTFRAQTYDSTLQKKSSLTQPFEQVIAPKWDVALYSFLDTAANALFLSFIAIGFLVIFLSF